MILGTGDNLQIMINCDLVPYGLGDSLILKYRPICYGSNIGRVKAFVKDALY